MGLKQACPTTGGETSNSDKDFTFWQTQGSEGTSAPIIGRYEREEIKPSIDVAAKIADALGVTIDYLLGKSDNMVLDKKTMQRLEDIEQLPDEDKMHIFYTIDNLIKAAKLKNIAAL